MRQLPRDRFDVLAVDLSPSDDAANLTQCADRVVRCGRSLPDLRAALAAEALDIAFYPDLGTDPVTYLLAHSRQARVQCTTWGHPVTTGIAGIDYFLSSELIEPVNAQSHYTERLVQFSVLPAYYYAPDAAEAHGTLNFPADWRIYLCPQSLFKLHPAFDDVIGQLLERDRAGRLVLLREREALESAFLRRIARKYPRLMGRIVFLDRMQRAQLLAVMRDSHVMLDTTPFGGGNTSYEALALGTPIVTIPGEFMRGRITCGLYRQMGIGTCIASGVEQYVDLAFRFGNDREFRESASDEIRSKRQSVYETTTAISELSKFFEEAHAEAPRQ